jgi:hypothetical protein
VWVCSLAQSRSSHCQWRQCHHRGAKFKFKVPERHQAGGVRASDDSGDARWQLELHTPRPESLHGGIAGITPGTWPRRQGPTTATPGPRAAGRALLPLAVGAAARRSSGAFKFKFPGDEPQWQTASPAAGPGPATVLSAGPLVSRQPP